MTQVTSDDTGAPDSGTAVLRSIPRAKFGSVFPGVPRTPFRPPSIPLRCALPPTASSASAAPPRTAARRSRSRLGAVPEPSQSRPERGPADPLREAFEHVRAVPLPLRCGCEAVAAGYRPGRDAITRPALTAGQVAIAQRVEGRAPDCRTRPLGLFELLRAATADPAPGTSPGRPRARLV